MWILIWGEMMYGPFKTPDTAAKYAEKKLPGTSIWSLKKLIGPTP